MLARCFREKQLFTEAENNHLFALLCNNEEEGFYFGNKEQYWKRHKRIKDKINNLTKLKKVENL